MKAQVAQILGAAILAALVTAPTKALADDDAVKYKQPAMDVTVIGCVQKETDYRRNHDLGKGGPIGFGSGLGDEYVLINATRVNTANPDIPIADCSAETTGEAFELTGGGEKDIKPFLGHFVEINGKMKKATVKTNVNGTPVPKPTGGGWDTTGQDLELFEVEPSAVRDYVRPPVVMVIPAPAPEAAYVPPAPAPEPQPEATSGREELPKTASSMPSVILVGALLLAAAFGIRIARAAL